MKASDHFCERRIRAASDPIEEIRAASGKDESLGPWITHSVSVYQQGEAAERLDFYAKAADACPHARGGPSPRVRQIPGWQLARLPTQCAPRVRRQKGCPSGVEPASWSTSRR